MSHISSKKHSNAAGQSSRGSASKGWMQLTSYLWKKIGMLWKNYGKAIEFLFWGSVRTLYVIKDKEGDRTDNSGATDCILHFNLPALLTTKVTTTWLLTISSPSLPLALIVGKEWLSPGLSISQSTSGSVTFGSYCTRTHTSP